MTQDARAARPLTFDLPVALLELLYASSVLSVGDGALPAVEVPERVAAPDGASERWAVAYHQVIDELDAGATPSPTWLRPEAASFDLDAARRWMHVEREKVIDSALLASKPNATRLTRRGRSLTGTAIRLVVVLPVAGRFSARPALSVLLTSLGTFLDDDAWQDATTELL